MTDQHECKTQLYRVKTIYLPTSNLDYIYAAAATAKASPGIDAKWLEGRIGKYVGGIHHVDTQSRDQDIIYIEFLEDKQKYAFYRWQLEELENL